MVFLPYVFWSFIRLIVFLLKAPFNLVRGAFRRRALARWCLGHGLKYNDKDAYYDYFHQKFFGLIFLDQGVNRVARNVMKGHWGGYPLCAFDYHYNSFFSMIWPEKYGNEEYKFKLGRRLSAVILECPALLCPTLVRPKKLTDRLAALFGRKGLVFAVAGLDVAEFGRAYCVTSNSQAYAEVMFHPEMIRHFMTAAGNFRVEFGAFHVAAYKPGRYLTPAEFECAANLLKGILDRLPTSLTKELPESCKAPGCLIPGYVVEDR